MENVGLGWEVPDRWDVSSHHARDIYVTGHLVPFFKQL